ncbi:hypothetical protein COX85_00270 [Candidatus Micrarchaeota archaeon CG_4_10_14_0_2_um_filter_55_9]|nr:MAG: hypothetical protein COX85_00270 [Candidatus Micrarchaeota archaeon CG_4_10_14_0_2_um_filter_55_9]
MKQSRLLWPVVVASMLLFFGVAFSTLGFWPKTIAALAVLAVCGVLVKRFTGQEGYYGLVIFRGLAGFKLMRGIARKHKHLSREIVDAGLGLAFGVPYAYHVYKKKFAKAALANLAFFAFFFLAQYFGGSQVNGALWLFTVVGVLFGLAGTGLAFLASHAWSVLTIPNTPPGVTLLVPGVTVPWEALFAIAVLAIVHEVAHGVLCVIERIPLKSSGVLLFGFLPVGAFVEPDEKRFEEKSRHVKRRMLVAGSIANVLFFFVFLVLALGAGAALDSSVASVRVTEVNTNSSLGVGVSVGDEVGVASANSFNALLLETASGRGGLVSLEVNGVKEDVRLFDLSVAGVEDGFPASQSFEEGEVIQAVNGEKVYGSSDLSRALAGSGEGDAVSIQTNRGVKSVVLGVGGRIGVTVSSVPAFAVEDVPSNAFLYALFSFLLVVFAYSYLLNFIVATVNLMPLFITDGHRILADELSSWLGAAAGGKAAFALGALTLLVLLLNALPWLWS